MKKIQRMVGIVVGSALLMGIPVAAANAAPPPVKKGHACYKKWTQGFTPARNYTLRSDFGTYCLYNVHEFSIVGLPWNDKYYTTRVYKV